VSALYPLSTPQREIWFDQMLHDGVPLYNIGGYVDLPGRIDPVMFEQAVNLLVRRHDSLRLWLTAERDADGLPLQVFVDPWPVRVPLVDVSGEADPEAAAQSFMRQRFEEPFSLEGQPLFRYDLIKLADDHYYWLLQYHHLSIDGWGLALLNRSLAALYSDLAGGRALALEAPSYGAYIADDRAYFESKKFEQQRAFWRDHHPQPPEPLLTPFYRGRFGGSLAGSGCEPMTLPRAFYDRLGALAETLGVSRFHVLLGALYVYFARTGQCDEVTVGLPVLNRANGVYKQTAGLFANQSPVRFAFGRALSFADLLERISSTLKTVYRHQRLPASEIRRAAEAHASSTRMFEVGLSYENHDYEAAFAGIDGLCTLLLHSWEQTPLQLFVRDFHAEQDIRVDFVYNQAYFTAGEIRALHERFRMVLETALSDPHRSIASWSILPEAERQQVLVEWNATEADYPKDQCIHQLFEGQAELTPDAIALVFEAQSLTYAQLNARANQLAHHLIHLGIRPDNRVAIGVERSLEMVVGLLAILKAGGAYVPLDPAYPEERLKFMLEDSAPVALLVHGATRERFAALAHGVPLVDLDADAAAWREWSDSNPEPAALGLRPNHLAYVIYTSGSTGKPKGVMVEHQGVSAHCLDYRDRHGLRATDRVLQMAEISFDASVEQLFPALLAGGRVIATKFDLEPSRFSRQLKTHDVTLVDISGVYWRSLVQTWQGQPELTPASTLRILIVGGDVMPADVMQAWRQLPMSQTTRLYNVYGPTETTVAATVFAVPRQFSGSIIPIGRPLANRRIYVLDGDGHPVPIGVAGEIHIGGAGVARGYLNRPELTAERFLPDPYAAEPDARMYRTGDLARWLPDGNLEYIGRADFQVKIRGFRIELGEIEAALRGCDGIREAVVLAREDSPGDKRLVAYVTVAGSAKVAGGIAVADGVDVADTVNTTDVAADIAALPALLKAQLRSSLPDYMLPAAFVVLEALPLTPNGKLDRKALPAPEADAYATGAYEPPVGSVEEALAELWRELLGIDRIGRHDDFFSLGGHSLLAVQLISRLRSALGLEVSLAELFARPVLAEFAAALVGAGAADGGLIPLADRSQPLPLSFAQRRLWFLAQLEGPSATYNMPLAWRLAGELDHQALRGALNQLVVRHEALRTSFVAVDGEPMQRIVPATDTSFALFEQDLRQTHDAEAELAHWLEKEAAEPFDLEAGPLLRGRLLQLADREHALLLTMHHAIADGWSLGVLGRELGALYRAMRQGEADPLPPLPIQYPDYAVWERQWVADALLQRQAAYWQSALAGAPVLLELPTDHPRPPVQDYVGAMLPLVIDAELTGKLKALARRHGATLFQVLLAGFAALLSRLSGQTEVVIGSPSAHRSRTELEGLIGFFVNTLALRIDTASSSVAELIAKAKEQTLAAQAHEDLPFEQVVELLQPPRSLAHAPLFQVMFAWQNTPEASLGLQGLTAEALAAPYGVAKFDLTLSLAETGERIEGNLAYATALFDPATVQRWVDYLQTLLIAIADVSADTEVGKLPLLSEAERQQVLVEWNATEADYPKDQCIHQLFETQAELTPEAIALVFEQQSLTYAQLNARANQLAHHLIHLGIKPDDRVAIGVERSLEMVVGLLAILKAGGAYVPLDPAYPEERLKFMLEDSKPVALLVHGATRERFAALSVDMPLVDLDGEAALWEELSATNPEPDALDLRPNHLAYVIYTSGSTGKPKGVMVEHRSVVHYLAWTTEAYRATLGLALVHSPIAFDLTVTALFTPLVVGGSVRIAALEDAPVAEVFTFLKVTPSHLPLLATLADTLKFTADAEFLFGGEALMGEALAPWRELYPQSTFLNVYGPTETTVNCCEYRIGPGQPIPSGPVPIGKPQANTRIYLLDGDSQPVPIGVAGEIHIGGAGVARGYLNRPELTAERFLLDPYAAEPDARMYRTGDLARWLPDGNLEYIGRADFQVKIRGFRIELGEIEAALRGCDGIREAVVLAREDVAGEKRLVAYVTADMAADTADIAALPAKLKAQLRNSLPDYMLPAAFVVLEALPLTPNGKLDRKTLPAPEANAYATGAYAPPDGPVEEALAALWSELLGIDRIGRHDDFFSLGGHSLLAVSLVERMRRQGLPVDVRALFTTPTLAELASVVGDGAEVAVPPNRIPPDCTRLTPDLLPLVSLEQAAIDRIVATVPGGAANVQDIYPLGPLQEGLLFHHLLQEEGDAYVLAAPFGFDNRERLQGFLLAFDAVIARHDIFRTAFAWEGLPEPVQVVWRNAPLPIEEVAFGPQVVDVSAALLERFDPRRQRLDLRLAPLFHAAIAEDPAQGRWLLLLRNHHLVADHTTLEVLFEEIAAYQSDRFEALPTPLPYRNFIAQARLGLSAEAHAAFFQELLAAVDEPTAPFGHLEVRGDGAGIEESRRRLEPSLAARLRQQARRLGVTPASLFHLAFARVLAATSGRSDVVFGTVLFGRLKGGEGADRMPGLFINTLPVRIEAGDEGVEAAIRRTHRTLAGLLRHEHAPLALAQRCSGVVAPAPLFSALLNYRHSPEENEGAVAAMWEGIELLQAEERTNYPLGISVDDLGQGFSLTAQTLPSVGAERLCGYLETATESLVAALESAPATRVREVAVLPEAERQQVLVEWNATEADYPKDQCIHQLFEGQAELTPDAIALVFEAQSLTYAQLNARANQLAHHLIHLGIRPDNRVAIGVERSLEMVVGLLAILKAGGAYVPLDPAYPEERLKFMLEDSAPVALLVHGATRERFAALAGAVPTINLEADAAAWAERSASNPEPDALDLRPNHLAYVIYTSGSTGRPKGVMVEHGSLVNLVLSHQVLIETGSTKRFLQFASLSFDVASWEIFTSLSGGDALYLASTHQIQTGLGEVLQSHAITHVAFPPSMFAVLDESNLPDLVYITVGGEACTPEQVTRWARGRHLVNAYGPTEATVCTTVFECRPDGQKPPIGRAIANARIYLLDGDGQPVPIGVSGEIHIGGAGVARGYLNRRELTAERFLPDPYSADPDARMYRTGDLARWLPDGNLEYIGRADFQVKIRGFRIELGEIEAALRGCDGIREAVVLAREDSPGEKRLVAYVTADTAADTVDTTAVAADIAALPAELKAQLRSSLPDYMLPAGFVVMEALPLTPNGKLDRKALPAPEADAYATGAYALPEGPVEEVLAELWSELLGIEQVGRHDDFFALGGHSLLAIRLISEIDQAFGVRLPVGAVFLRPTLSELAEALGDSRLAEEAAALVPLRPEGVDPPLFLLPGAIGSVLYLQPLAEALGEGRPVLALPTPGLDGRPTLESMTELAAHHLRTLRRWQPRGPYLLAGHSSGGRVAFEMAQQLERQGETVARLVILDTNAPDPDQDRPNRTEREVLADLVEVFEELGGVALGISREAILSEPNAEDAYAKVMVAFQVNGVLFSRGAAVAELKALAAVYRSAVITHQGLRIAERLRAPIHLLLASDRGGSEAFVDQRPAWGWAEGTEQEVVVDEVPGTHITMMAPPHVAVLAARLGAILAAACGGAESGITTPAKAVAVAEAVA
jgi:amino acid adenylation domain-containing protein